jgi:hypothetical protein
VSKLSGLITDTFDHDKLENVVILVSKKDVND